MNKFIFNSSLLFFCFVFSGAQASQQLEADKVWADGTRYIGELIRGKQEGKGQLIWPDGTQFIGTFRNGLRHGVGSLILADDSTYFAIFKNDVVVPGSLQREGFAVPQSPVPVSAKYLGKMNEQFELELSVRAASWIEAWSSQDLANYFSHYSTDFIPANGATIDAWRELRYSRVSSPSSIEIGLKDFNFETSGSRDVIVVFEQRYKSNSFFDVTRKQLNFRLEEGEWKILREQVL